MITLVVLLILSIILLWLLVMYGVWKKTTKQQEVPDALEVLTPVYNKSTRLLRRAWFWVLRYVKILKAFLEKIATKAFFAIFPNARKAFEKKDELTGLEHGPSSYFLMSVSEYKDELQKNPPSGIKKDRRKKKNV
jgi:hypothetical protein